MRKKFTMLFAALLACVGVMKAEVTDLPEMSTGDDIKWYTIKNVRQNKYATYAGDAATMTQDATASAASFFYFTASETEGAVKIHNYAAGDNLCAAYNSWTATGIDWYLAAQSTGVSICTSTGEWNAWNDASGAGQKIEYWSASDAGSAWEISLVTDFSSIIDIAAVKTAACEELDNLAKITVLFGDATDAKADVEAVTAAGTGLDELNAAVETINAVVAEYKKQVNGKNVRFTSYGRNTTDGTDITATTSGAYHTSLSGDAGIWTLTSNEDGSFKMYNFVSNVYMGATTGNGSHVATCSDFADAAPYTFNAIAENTTNLWNKGNTLHADGWGKIVQWNPDNTTSAASIFTVSVEPAIVVTREEYDAAAAAKTSLPYAIQQAYGLVTDAANYYSNYKSDAEGSYEELLDNASDSYFHSAYNDEAGDGTGVHYIQADLGEGNSVDEFYFYMAPRNANNRPVNITVYGLNSLEETPTEIAQVTTTLASSDSYISAKLGTDGTNYRYIRLTVTSTNTSSVFFTLSELYFFPATSDVTSLVDSYNAFATSSITSEDMASAATALVNAESVLALANIKKEVDALLTANASNHAEAPALGQYTTEAYNALQTAYNATDATQESLEAAIAAFNLSKNSPVFTISGVKDYVVGKSIYDNNSGTLYFKATNVYDKTMWWAFDQTTTTVGVTEEVVVTNVATGNGFWGAASIKVAETSDAVEGADDGIFLFYTTGNGTPVHFQNDNQQIVRWSSTESTSGSAATFTYIGNTYDLAKLTDEHITALTGLQATYDANEHLTDVTLGNELGVYSGDKTALTAALAAADVILAKSLVDLAAMAVADVEAAKAAITDGAAAITFNVPVAGNYYRIKAVAEWNDDAPYLGSQNSTEKEGRAEFVADGNNDSTIFYYDGATLYNCVAKKYLVSNSNMLGYSDNEEATASKIAFLPASNGLAGAFNITFNEGARYLYADQNNYTNAGGGTDAINGYCLSLIHI